MSNKEIHLKSSGVRRMWAITLTAMVIAFGGILLSCMCIFPLPGNQTMPITGSFFYLFGSFVLASCLALEFRKENSIDTNLMAEAIKGSANIVVNESKSVHVLKWMISLFLIFFAFFSAVLALVCIFRLPDNTVQPQAAILFLLSGITVMSILVFTLWKNQPAIKIGTKNGANLISIGRF
jgi:hypothetical protein